MNITESLAVAGFVFSMVFVVLAILFILIKIFSFVIRTFESKATKTTN